MQVGKRRRENSLSQVRIRQFSTISLAICKHFQFQNALRFGFFYQLDETKYRQRHRGLMIEEENITRKMFPLWFLIKYKWWGRLSPRALKDYASMLGWWICTIYNDMILLVDFDRNVAVYDRLLLSARRFTQPISVTTYTRLTSTSINNTMKHEQNRHRHTECPPVSVVDMIR